MLRALDPHTNFLSPQAFSSMREKQQASFYGLGILVGMRDGRLTVITPIDGTPASRLGIRAGDVIHTIEGEPTDGLAIDEAVSRLKGPKDTQVRITILRAGLDEPLELTVTRAEIPQTTVRYSYMIEPGTGYLAISDFSRSTGDEVARAIEKLRGQGMKRLLLDLRNNGGGLLDQAVEVADQFLPKGSTIVETRGRVRDSLQSFSAAGRPARAGRAGGRAGQQRHRLGGRDPLRRHPGPRRRPRGRHADLGQGAGADRLQPLLRRRPRAHHGQVLHAVRATDPARLQLLLRLLHPRRRRGRRRGRPAARPRTPPAEEFKTDLGRKVYGGGGITPDVEVKPTEIAPFLQFLLSRSAFFSFAVEYANRHPALDRAWMPGADVLDEFGAFLVEKKIDTAEDVAAGLADDSHRGYALRQIRAEVFTSKFGVEAAHQVLAQGDAQIQSALSLFPRAAELVAERSRLAHPPDVRAEVTGRD